MLILTEADVRRMLAPEAQGMDIILGLLESGFRSLAEGQAANQPRRRVRAPGGAMLHMMSAGDAASGCLGAKIYSTSREGARFFLLLFDHASGRPLASIEADYLGQMRTGAASGLATKLMSRDDARVLAVIGSGGQAWTQVLAISRVRLLSEVRVHSRRAEGREAFAARVRSELGIAALACAESREAVRGASIIATATTSATPVVLGEWIEPGTHINAAGGNAANRAELDTHAVQRAAIAAVDSLEQARIESGELIAANRWDDVVEFAEIVSGAKPGRRDPSEITLFKSNGIALEDIVVAGWLFRQAQSGAR